MKHCVVSALPPSVPLGLAPPLPHSALTSLAMVLALTKVVLNRTLHISTREHPSVSEWGHDLPLDRLDRVEGQSCRAFRNSTSRVLQIWTKWKEKWNAVYNTQLRNNIKKLLRNNERHLCITLRRLWLVRESGWFLLSGSCYHAHYTYFLSLSLSFLLHYQLSN